jgi:SpoVK/Ycf46/Vps4 family AAA+-type ATPase
VFLCSFLRDRSVMVLATSNKPWDLDEALRRRLERRIYVPLPDEASRAATLAIHLKGVSLAADVDAGELAAATDGYSGADLQIACRDASSAHARRDQRATPAAHARSPRTQPTRRSQGALRRTPGALRRTCRAAQHRARSLRADGCVSLRAREQ